MVLMRRQTSTPGNQSVDFSDYDASSINRYQSRKSERSFTGVHEFGTELEQSKPFTKAQWFTIFQYMVLAAVVYYSWTSNANLSKTKSEIFYVDLEYESLQETLLETEEELRHAHDDFTKLQMKLKSTNNRLTANEKVKDNKGRMVITDTLLERHQSQAKRIVAMQKRIQDINRNELVQK